MRPNWSKNKMMIFGTALILGAIFSLYFLVYVKKKEKEINENNFRVLEQIYNNIHELEESYYYNVETKYRNEIEEDNDQKTFQSSLNEKITKVKDTSSIDCQQKITNKITFCKNEVLFEIETKDNPGPSGSDKKDQIKNEYYSIKYDDFFENRLLQREDVFDYIVLSKYNKNQRLTLYSSSHSRITDSLFYNKKLLQPLLTVSLEANKYIMYNQHLKDDIFISGLVDKSKFESQKRGVSIFTIITASVVLLFIVLNMPMLKLLLMSIGERLYGRDVVLTAITILLGSSILLLLLFTAVIHTQSERKSVDIKLDSLSSKIERNFESELSCIVTQLTNLICDFPLDSAKLSDTEDKFYSLALGDNLLDRTFCQVSTRKLEQTDNFNVSGFRLYGNIFTCHPQKNHYKFDPHKYFNYIFWSDANGQALITLSPFRSPSYAQDLHHRVYLSNIYQDTPLSFCDSLEIGFESIKSVNDGSYEVGVGISSKNETLPVLAMSSKMISVMDAVVPNGYGFCILNKEGNTVFHSDKQKNLNENFLEETKSVFSPYIASNNEVNETVDYGGKSNIIHFKRLECLPGYYLATFTPYEFYSTPYALILNNSVLLFLAYLLLLGMLFFLFFLILNRKNKMIQNDFMFNWLRPIEGDYHRYIYSKITFCNGLVISSLMISLILFWHNQDLMINNLLAMTIFSLSVSYFVLTVCLPIQKRLNTKFSDALLNLRSISLMYFGLLVLILFFFSIVRFRIDFTPDHALSEKIASIMNLIVIIFYSISSYQIIKSSRVKKKNESKSTNSSPTSTTENTRHGWLPIKISHQTSYQLFMFSWVILLSIIPTIIFFSMCFEKEKHISTRYNLVKTYEKLKNWDAITDEEFKLNFNRDDYKDFKNSMRERNLYKAIPQYDATLIEVNESLSTSFIKFNRILFDSIYQFLRPSYNVTAMQTNGFIKDSLQTFNFNHTKDSIRNYFQISKDDIKLRVELSGLENFVKNDWFILLFSIVIVHIIYFLIVRLATNKIYGFDYKLFATDVNKLVKKGRDHLLKEIIFERMKKSTTEIGNHKLIVCLEDLNLKQVAESTSQNRISILHFDFNSFYQEDIQIAGLNYSFIFDKEGNFKHVDYNQHAKRKKTLDEFNISNYEQILVCLSNFGCNYKNTKLNRVKFNVVNFLIKQKQLRIVLSSPVNSLMLRDFYSQTIKNQEELLGKNFDQINKNKLLDEMDELSKELSQWKLLLKNFTEVILPLESSRIQEKQDIIYQELDHGKYLAQQSIVLSDKLIGIKSFGSKNVNQNEIQTDDAILHIHQMSNTYYSYILESLSSEEKHIVYDIAKNKFVNTTNSIGVFNLLKKGVLVYDYTLRSFNESFSNYVLSRTESDEDMEKEVVSRKSGVWSRTFTILLLVIVGLVIFLIIGQQNYLSDFNSFLTAIAALLGVLLRFGGFFSPVSK